MFFCFQMSTILAAFDPKACRERVGVYACVKQATLVVLGPWATLPH